MPAAHALFRRAALFLGVALAVGSAVLTLRSAGEGGLAGAGFATLLGGFAAPDPAVLPAALFLLAETLGLAVLGSLGALALAALLAAMPALAAPLAPVLGAVLAPLRSLPAPVLALLLVFTWGAGVLAGAVALAVHSAASLTAGFVRAAASADRAPGAALRLAGANGLQRLRFAIWPQVGPALIEAMLRTFRRNLRDAVLVGLAGAGGIGMLAVAGLRAGRADQIAAAAIAVIAFGLVAAAAGRALKAAGLPMEEA
jgi:ABC-type phosphate/phosphonate transport system permease subunit